MNNPDPPRAICALCGKPIICVRGRWTHKAQNWSAVVERHTAQPKREATA